jgi:hypothetical protein
MKTRKDDACKNGFCKRLAPKSMKRLLPRHKMPQFHDLKDMKEFSKQIGIPGNRLIVPLSSLRVSQGEIRISRSQQIAEKWKRKKMDSPLLVSLEEDGKHAIVDGHHRLMAALILQQEGYFDVDEPMNVYCIPAPVSFLLQKAVEHGKNKIPQYF